METKIRPATEEDEGALTDLMLDFKEEHSRMIGGEKDMEPETARKEVRTRLKCQDEGYFVAVPKEPKREQCNLLGFRRWKYEEDFYFSKTLYVRPEARRSGVARALIRHFEDWLVDKGQEIACITCTPHNVAMINLARSEGYDILNTVELRKNLTSKPPEPRKEKEALGLNWKVL